MKLKIHPAVGVARLGNSTTDICLSPDSIGGLPYAAASFAPISSMGIGFAISSACNAIMAHYYGHDNAIADYQKNITNIFDDYLKIRSQFYSKEQRWLTAPFWQRRVSQQAIVSAKNHLVAQA